MHSVGTCAGDQLYISWKDAVKNAMTRYQIVSEKYKSGQYKSHRKSAEFFIKANGELMDDIGDLLMWRDNLRKHIKDKRSNNK